MEEPKRKEPMSEEERAKLAQKLDEDLDRFMETMAAQSKENAEKKPFDFDEWCKELDKNPLFMKDLKPDENGELPESIQALQALKYDEDEAEDRVEQAERHKNEGNKHFKFKKYRWAIDAYTNGLKACCADAKLNAVLYANRAAANRHIGNIRTAIRDSVFARKFDPTHCKAILRCAECLLELGYGERCLQWVEFNLASLMEESTKPENSEKAAEIEKCLETLDGLRKEAVRKVMEEKRNARREMLLAKQDLEKKRNLLGAFKARNLRFRPPILLDDPDVFEWSQIAVELPQLNQHPTVYLGDDDELVWPLLLQYPQVGQTDTILDCSENATIASLVAEVLSTPASWDPTHEFRSDNVRFFVALDVFEEEQVAEVHQEQTLREILSSKDVVVVKGLPVIQVYAKNRLAVALEAVCDGRYRFRNK
ncbi:Protein C17G10.2 [Aphelenchoides avenae]|nr:Protein C17G10.2 [Aphelenchus avenae]